MQLSSLKSGKLGRFEKEFCYFQVRYLFIFTTFRYYLDFSHNNNVKSNLSYLKTLYYKKEGITIEALALPLKTYNSICCITYNILFKYCLSPFSPEFVFQKPQSGIKNNCFHYRQKKIPCQYHKQHTPTNNYISAQSLNQFIYNCYAKSSSRRLQSYMPNSKHIFNFISLYSQVRSIK